MTTQPATLAREIEIAGHRWSVYPLGCMDQFTVECIFARVLGVPLGYALGAVVEAAAPPFIEFLREWASRRGPDGPHFDLAALLDNVDTDDVRVRETWERLLAGLGEAAANAARGFAAALGRLEPADLHRLSQLVMFNKLLHVYIEGTPRVVDSPDTFDKLVRRDPTAKWAVLAAALAVTYRSAEPDSEAPG